MVDGGLPDGSAEASPGVGRRRFLTYVAAAPTLTVAAQLAAGSGTAEAQPAVPSLPQVPDVMDGGDAMIAATSLTASQMVLEITPEGKVRFELPRVEMGQGLTTTVAMILAEELDARLSDVVVVLSDSRPELMFNQMTALSSSVRTLWKPLRTMAATARARLVTAAAQRWNVPANTLTTRDTSVVAADGRNASFGSLSTDASKVTPVVPGTPKAASQYKVIGKPTGRVDARDIVTGKAKYAMDVKVPGALPTVVARPPTMNGTVVSFDDSAARRMPGVAAVTKLPSGVAVSATTFHEAMKAKDALKVTWGAGPADSVSDSDIQAKLAEKARGFLAPQMQGSTIDASFEFASVTHAPMEVMNATARVQNGKVDVWCASQTPVVAQQEIAKQLGVPQSAVTIHVMRAGGSFGRLCFWDAAAEAAQVAKAIGKPVKLMWTRNDDTRHGRMRPAAHHKIRATLSGNSVLSYEQRMATVQTDFRHGVGEMFTAAGVKTIPPIASQGFFQISQTVPYNFGGVSMSLSELNLDIPTGSWRSVYSGTFRIAEEVVVDELAKQMGQDPVEFRLRLLKDDKVKAVLRKAAELGKWGRSMPKGWAQGIGIHEEYRSAVACLVEINATDPKNPRVTKAVMAVDVGRPINPRGLQAQMSGGLMDGISTVLQAGLHIDKGAVREGSFSDFHWARQRNAPLDLQVHVMPASRETPGGAAELGVPAAGAAVANAYARATGTQPRRFPINF